MPRSRADVRVAGNNNATTLHGDATVNNFSTWLLDVTVDLLLYPDQQYITPGEIHDWAEDGLSIELKNCGQFTQKLSYVPALLFSTWHGAEVRYQPTSRPAIEPVEQSDSRRVYHIPVDDLRCLFATEEWKHLGAPKAVRACVDFPQAGGRACPIRVLGNSWRRCDHLAPYWMPRQPLAARSAAAPSLASRASLPPARVQPSPT